MSTTEAPTLQQLYQVYCDTVAKLTYNAEADVQTRIDIQKAMCAYLREKKRLEALHKQQMERQ